MFERDRREEEEKRRRRSFETILHGPPLPLQIPPSTLPDSEEEKGERAQKLGKRRESSTVGLSVRSVGRKNMQMSQRKKESSLFGANVGPSFLPFMRSSRERPIKRGRRKFL